MKRCGIACLLLVAACTGPRLVAYTPLDKKTDLDEKKLYDAAEGVLLDKGFLIKTRDEAGHRLETEPRTMLGSEITKDKFKYVFTVEIGGGNLHIQLQCRDADSGQACGKEVPEKMVKDQRQIADGILAEAGGK